MEIRITNKAYSKLRYYILECQTEVSGLGKIKEVKEETLVSEAYTNQWGYEIPAKYEMVSYLQVYDVEVLPQEVSGAHSDLDEEALAKFLFNKSKKKESVVDYRFWWHSHVDFSAFFSGTDTDTIEISTGFPFLVSLVMNKRGDYSLRYDQWKPCRLTIEKLELKVEGYVDDDLKEQCKKDLKKNVKEIKAEPILLDAPHNGIMLSQDDEEFFEEMMGQKPVKKWGLFD